MKLHYTVFETAWGYFGIAGSENCVVRTCLPAESEAKAIEFVTKGLDCEYSKSAFKELQAAVKAYFKGSCGGFNSLCTFDLPLNTFGQNVLTACAQISAGKVLTYGQLASKIRHPGAARAVGSALASNPIPLLIPCHRVLRSDGKMGGFTAPGGIELKKRLLSHEKACF